MDTAGLPAPSPHSAVINCSNRRLISRYRLAVESGEDSLPDGETGGTRRSAEESKPLSAKPAQPADPSAASKISASVSNRIVAIRSSSAASTDLIPYATSR